MRVAMPVFPGVEDLTVSGVAAVLAAARDLGVPDARLTLVAEEAVITTGAGTRFVPHTLGWDALTHADVLVVPGHRDPDAFRPDPALAHALRAHLDAPGADRLLATASNGLFVLARAGLLEGRHVVAPRAHRDALARVAGDVITGRRVHQDGRLVTAAGPSAALDLALHVVERSVSPDVAGRIADALEVRGWVASGVADV